MNIFLDQLFVNPANGDFHILEGSPCIDAGDPAYPLDPDGSIVDIGRFYFDQTGINDNTIIQTKNYLHQNYPNPFNPETAILFNLTAEDAENAEISIYNIKGQKVKEFLDLRNQTSVVWNGRDSNGNQVSSGVYFYKLESESYSETKKTLMIK